VELLFDDESDINLQLDAVNEAKIVIDAVLEHEQCPYETEIEVLLTDNAGIQDFNNCHRGIDAPTDVLSFPMVLFLEPGVFDFLEKDERFFNPDTGNLILGSIIISKEKILTQAKEYGHSIRREYTFLIAHSMLHLVGYDHMKDDDAKVMESKQEEILNQLGITR